MDDDLILPSDPEELEELRAEEDLEGYWTNAITSITRNLAVMKEWNKSAFNLNAERTRAGEGRLVRSDDEGAMSRPRKRTKLAHAISDENILKLHNGSVSNKSIPHRTIQDISNADKAVSYTGTSSNRASLLEPKQHARRNIGPSGPDPEDYINITRRKKTTYSPSSISSGALHMSDAYEPLPSDDLPIIGHSTSSQSYVIPSPTQSPDPLRLFSPTQPLVTPTSRRITHSPPKLQLSVDVDDDGPIAGPSRLNERFRSPSTLSSPVPSSSRRFAPSPRSQNPSPPSSPLSSPGDTGDESVNQVPPEPAMDMLFEDLQQAGRYSLRERNIRQLNPYHYDWKVYARQMRSNPEAIVKLRHLPKSKRNGQPSSLQEALSSDAEVNSDDFEPEASDGEPRPRRGRSSEPGPSTNRHRRSNSARSEDGGKPKPRSRPRIPVSEVVPALPPARNVAEEWYRAKLQELDSSGSDGERDDLPSSSVRPPDKAQFRSLKRRKKRFPMNRARRSISPASRLPIQAPSSPPPQMTSARSEGDSSDVEIISNDPGPGRSRFRSVENEQDPRGALDDASLDERFPSPASHPPTSSSARVSDDFDLELGPNRWDSPPFQGSDVAMSDADIPLGRNRSIAPSYHISSDDDHDEEESDAASMTSEQLEVANRRRYKELYRMYPAVKVREMLKNGTAFKKKPHKPAPTQRKHSEVPEDGPLRPGQTRVRIGTRNKSASIRGDSESSDVEIRLSSSRSSSPSPPPSRAGPSSIALAARRTTSLTTIYISSDSDSNDDGPQEDPDSWVNEPTALHERGLREGTLVDYMLNRTNGGRRNKSGKHGVNNRTGRSGNTSRHNGAQGKRSDPKRRAGRSGPSTRTRVTVGAARRYGPKRQSLLNFPRVERATDTIPTTSDFALDLSVGKPKDSSLPSNPAWKKNRNRTRDRVYFLKPKVVKVVSGRVVHEPRTTVIEQEAPEIQVMRFPSQVPPPMRRLRHPAPLKPRPIVSREDGGGILERQTRSHSPTELPRKTKDTITVDMGITQLPSGISFSDETYIAKGFLHDLLSPPAYHDPPNPGYVGPTRITETTSSSEFLSAVEEAIGDIVDKLQHSSNAVTHQDDAEWQRYLQAIRLWTTWYLSSLAFDEAETLRTGVGNIVQRIYTLANDHFAVRADESAANLLVLRLQWTAVELICTTRRTIDQTLSANDVDSTRHIKLLMHHLWACNVDMKLHSLWPVGIGRLHYDRPIHFIAELWVCLISLIEAVGERGFFWALLQQTVQDFDKLRLWSSQLSASEATWASIYGFSALSQFTRRGLTTPEFRLHGSWKFVATALAPFHANPAADAKIPERGLKKRDKYIKLLISRCFRLHTHWKWSLEDSSPLLHRIFGIFNSRRFANLLHEKVADFPAFLKEHRIELLFTQQEDDSAYTLFLKLVVRAAIGSIPTLRPEISQSMQKILWVIVPLGSVPFKKSLPASLHESSMLYNRLSAVAVRIYLERTPANAKTLLTNARRYVNFKETDQGTRQACIRGIMYLAILLQHLELPLEEALDWLGELTNCLVDEFIAVYRDETKLRQKNDIVKTIQMILACTRRIIETPHMDSITDRTPRYPAPSLIQGPWVTRVFSTSAALASTLNTALEMRMLIQAFLKARIAVIPRPVFRRALPVVQEESQEDYGEFFFDLDDPAVAAALGNADPVDGEIKAKEEETCKVIDEPISKAVFRVLCAHLSSRKQQDQVEIDRWVECWIGCAEVLVRNGRRNWASYFDQASQTWERMRLEPSVLRRMTLHISLTVLKFDPSSYSTQDDQYMQTFFQCMATSQPELEAEYIGLLFTVDNMQHDLLHSVPAPESDEAGRYHLTRVEFMERRISYLEHVLRNLENRLTEDSGINPSTSELHRKYVGYIATMIAAMQDIYKCLDIPGQAVYKLFCDKVFRLLSQNANIQGHPILRNHVSWLKSL